MPHDHDNVLTNLAALSQTAKACFDHAYTRLMVTQSIKGTGTDGTGTHIKAQSLHPTISSAYTAVPVVPA